MADFPYYLREQTEDAIRQRMLERLPADLDKSEGSFLWDAQAPAAYLLSEAALWAQELLRRGFASTAASEDAAFRSEELDLRAAEHGVNRRGAAAAEGTVLFTGEAGRRADRYNGGFAFGCRFERSFQRIRDADGSHAGS